MYSENMTVQILISRVGCLRVKIGIVFRVNATMKARFAVSEPRLCRREDVRAGFLAERLQGLIE